MTKLGNKIRNVLEDLTIGDLEVCPIDDHMTIGVQNVKITIPPIKVKNITTKPIIIINNCLIDTSYLIF